jgi:hypothetical protein
MGASGAAGATSLASIGLQAYSTILQSQGTADADQYQAQKLEQAATYGDLKAVQIGGQMTRNLNQTLGNIDAVRAAANADPTSPTGAAVRDNAEAIGTDQKNITVDSILAQSNQERNDAAYYRSAASNALFAGDISAGAGIVGGIAKGIAGIAVPAAASATGGLSLTATGGLY